MWNSGGWRVEGFVGAYEAYLQSSYRAAKRSACIDTRFLVLYLNN